MQAPRKLHAKLRDAVYAYLNENIKIHAGTGCWNWVGEITSQGQLRARVALVPGAEGDRQRYGGVSPRRVAWLLYRNDRFSEERRLLAECGNPRCVNPDHMRIIGGIVKVDRMLCADGTPRAGVKATPKLVLEVRRRIAKGDRGNKIAAALGISQSMVTRIRRGISWADIQEPAPKKEFPIRRRPRKASDLLGEEP